MDPWLEGHVWPDVHHGLAFVFKEQLVARVIPKYFVRVETYTVEDTNPQEEVGIMYPDVEILKKQPEPHRPTKQGAGGIEVLTPATMIIGYRSEYPGRGDQGPGKPTTYHCY